MQWCYRIIPSVEPHPTFTDVRDFAQATLEKFDPIDDSLPTLGCVNTEYGGCAVGTHFAQLDRDHLDTWSCMAALFPGIQGGSNLENELCYIIGLHDGSRTVGKFKEKLRLWLAEHPYQVQFPIVKVSEAEVVVP